MEEVDTPRKRCAFAMLGRKSFAPTKMAHPHRTLAFKGARGV